MYFMNLIESKFQEISHWLKAEPRAKDRITTATMGLWAGIWLGVIFACIFTSPTPIVTLFWFAIAGSVMCSAIGGFFPKYPRIVFYPFYLLLFFGGN